MENLSVVPTDAWFVLKNGTDAADCGAEPHSACASLAYLLDRKRTPSPKISKQRVEGDKGLYLVTVTGSFVISPAAFTLYTDKNLWLTQSDVVRTSSGRAEFISYWASIIIQLGETVCIPVKTAFPSKNVAFSNCADLFCNGRQKNVF